MKVLAMIPIAAALVIALPTSPAEAYPILAARGCMSQRPGKRARCITCVNGGGRFQTQGRRRPGFCQPGTRPRPRPHVSVIADAATCNTIGRRGKRARCLSCVSRGGQFHRLRHGRCQMPVTPVGVIVDAPTCNTIRRHRKRRRCLRCVSTGGRYYRQGRGRCATPPPPQVTVILDQATCSNTIARPGKRRRCLRCVSRGRRFHRQGAARGFCERARTPPPAAAIIQDVRSCYRLLVRPAKRTRCAACVRRRMAFDTQGAGIGFCRTISAPTPPPPPPPPAPTLSVRLGSVSARRGNEVRLYLSPPRTNIEVYFNGRILPKKVLNRGSVIVVTVPATANSGFFEVSWAGRRFRANRVLNVLP